MPPLRVIVELRRSRINRTLNATVVRAPQYLEGPSISPVVVPGVGCQPVRKPILLTPAQQSDSVAPNLNALQVLINSTLVVHEILINVRTNVQRQMLNNIWIFEWKVCQILILDDFRYKIHVGLGHFIF